MTLLLTLVIMSIAMSLYSTADHYVHVEECDEFCVMTQDPTDCCAYLEYHRDAECRGEQSFCRPTVILSDPGIKPEAIKSSEL